MGCLLAAATKAEIAPFLQWLQKEPVPQRPGVLITGVGMLASTWQLTRYLRENRPAFIVQAGIAGCFDRSVPLGSLFVVNTDAVADLGVEEKTGWTDIFDMGFARASGFPFRQKKLFNPHKDLLKRTGLPKATAITVNTITGSRKQLLQRQQHYAPLLESMEGAALHYVALQEKVPFIQVRSVSNYAGERNKQKWAMAAAIENLNAFLLRFFGKEFYV